MLASLRVLIVHDWIVAWGGAERTVEEMLGVFPRADIVVGVLGDGRRNLNDVTRRVKETWLAQLPLARRQHRWFLPLYPAAFRSLDTRGYDLVLSSSSAFSKCVAPQRGVPHVCYCHTPPRYLWDLTEEYSRDANVRGAMLSLAGPLLRKIDRASADGVTKFLANSEFVAARIQRAYGRTAAVVYPPVSRKPATPRFGPRSDALLSLGRLVPYKRVDLAIQAANALGARLIVAGEGPERPALERMAGPSVEFVGHVSERQAGELMEFCRAMLFCAEEDFGIAPVEANAHGLPVIAYNRGAARESMRDGITAVFFDDAPGSLLKAIQRSELLDWQDAELRANAVRFDAGRFRDELAREVLSVL